MTPAPLVESNIRLFCDSDKRFVLLPDNPLIPDNLQNHNLEPDEQYWWDPINELLREPGEHELNPDEWAQTYDNILLEDEDFSTQPYMRSTVAVSGLQDLAPFIPVQDSHNC